MSSITESSFGTLLREHRLAAGLSQEALAERAGLATQAVGALERGDRRRPYPETLRRLADALNLSAAERAAFMTAATVQKGGGSEPDHTATPSTVLSRASMQPYLTSLIGRESDIAALKSRLAQEVRLITLTGPGGVGKTRLALAVGAELEAQFADGVVFVGLAPVADPALVLPTIAHALGMREASGVTAWPDVLQTYLASRSLLLVLDNLEHVLGAAQDVADLLGTCPRLAVLATSRAPLRILGEQEWPVAPLAAPRGAAVAAEIATADAVRLFVERARAVAPGFVLTDTNAGAVAGICRRLDGLPLALELAAAWIKLLPPAALFARLERALPMLGGGPRNLPERQRTMRDALAWSYQLLGSGEQALFRRLAVFAGGWTLESAEMVCSGNGIEADEVLGLLLALVQQSLVLTEHGAAGAGRYRMLEPVRQYARELLEAGPDFDHWDRRHGQFFLALAEQAEQAIRGRLPDQVAWLDRLEEENDNLRAAIDRSLGRHDTETTVHFGWALCMYWVMRSRHSEGRHWLERALEPERGLTGAARARALYALSCCVYGSGEDARLLAMCEETLALARESGEAVLETYALGMAGFALLNLGETDRAEAALQLSLSHCQALGDTWAGSHILSHLAVVPLRRGDYELAVDYAQQALTGTRETGDHLATYVSLLVLAQAAQASGDIDRATRYFAEAIEVAAAVSDRVNASYSLQGLAEVAVSRGDLERAARLLAAAEAILETTNSPRYAYVPDRRLNENLARTVRARLGEEAWDAASKEGRAVGLDGAVRYALAD